MSWAELKELWIKSKLTGWKAKASTWQPSFSTISPQNTKAHFTLGVKANVQTQIKHSYWCKKLKSVPPGAFYTRSQVWHRRNIFSICPKFTNKCWTLWPWIGPQGWIKKKDTMEFGEPILQSLGPMFDPFTNNLGPINKPKMLKVSSNFFGPWLRV
jgi:hypothetical protein